MISLHERQSGKTSLKMETASNRRQFRRHDLEPQGISVERFDGARRVREKLGQIVDISAGGVRIRTSDSKLRADNQVRVRLELPAYAGICPFVDTNADQPQPKREWTGWLTISRVQPIGGDRYDVAGRLVDMEEMDRGMLGLYLSTQPLAA
ncbi:MAG TPA: PilZ domain-containing protein [Tepidisphaeraceae bacterium]|nr:PilZ domain-containing protein [Tepidisphaeraceae bacterium]